MNISCFSKSNLTYNSDFANSKIAMHQIFSIVNNLEIQRKLTLLLMHKSLVTQRQLALTGILLLSEGLS
jgi:hypothetical protein